VALRAHMHLRGKSFQMRAVYPNGESEILLDIPKFDFNWQPYYYLETPKSVPRGTRIESTGYFDNSPIILLIPTRRPPCFGVRRRGTR